jgi:hypothetical protein
MDLDQIEEPLRTLEPNIPIQAQRRELAVREKVELPTKENERKWSDEGRVMNINGIAFHLHMVDQKLRLEIRLLRIDTFLVEIDPTVLPCVEYRLCNSRPFLLHSKANNVGIEPSTDNSLDEPNII